MDLGEVRAFAIDAHGDQRYDDLPYEHHLASVVEIISTWTGRADLIAAAWLHDVLEDTEIDRAAMAIRFGDGVADLVWAVTAEGETRAEMMDAIYRKIAALPDAALVKLADRVANVEAAPATSRHRARYLAERDGFGRAVRPHVPANAWARLEQAYSSSFPRLPPVFKA